MVQVQALTRGLTGMVATRRSKTGTVAAAVTVAPAAAVTVTVPAATAAATVHAHSHLIQLADLSSSDDDEDLFDEPAPQQPVRGRGRGRGRGSKRGAGRQPAARPRKRAKTPAQKAPKLSEWEKLASVDDLNLLKKNVLDTYWAFPAATLEKMWKTKIAILQRIIACKGGNNYKIGRVSKA